MEEILFRGFAYQAVRGRLGRWPSILLTSLLFSALHANAAVFLSSPMSSFTTGINMVVDGAMTGRVNF
jgi:membrane protease YdiL (CAAX protease family)